MGERVDSRDVLDANARTRRKLRGLIRGHFSRTGPNRWDDYEFIPDPDPSEVIEVLPDVKVQYELKGLEFRMRDEGRVIRVEWLPDEADQASLALLDEQELHLHFVSYCFKPFDEKPGYGAAPVIADKLRD